MWLKPTTTSRAPSVRTSASSTKVSASIREKSSVNGMTRVASRPCSAMRARFSSSVAMGAGAFSGRSTAVGCGSKVHATAETPSARARSTAVSRILACARWMPSKAPKAATDGRSSGGKDGRSRRIRMKEPFGLHPVAEPLPHPEQAAVGAVHAERGR